MGISTKMLYWLQQLYFTIFGAHYLRIIYESVCIFKLFGVPELSAYTDVLTLDFESRAEC